MTRKFQTHIFSFLPNHYQTLVGWFIYLIMLKSYQDDSNSRMTLNINIPFRRDTLFIEQQTNITTIFQLNAVCYTWVKVRYFQNPKL